MLGTVLQAKSGYACACSTAQTIIYCVYINLILSFWLAFKSGNHEPYWRFHLFLVGTKVVINTNKHINNSDMILGSKKAANAFLSVLLPLLKDEDNLNVWVCVACIHPFKLYSNYIDYYFFFFVTTTHTIPKAQAHTIYRRKYGER